MAKAQVRDLGTFEALLDHCGLGAIFTPSAAPKATAHEVAAPAVHSAPDLSR